MRTHIPAQSHLAQCPRPVKSGLRMSSICLTPLLGAFIFLIPATLNASTQSTTPRATPHKSTQAHKSASTAKRPAAVPQMPPETAAPPAPKPPNWPANDHPANATVVWNSQGLRIDAANSNLSQILNEVSTVIGIKVEGFAADQRIFGTYGPGPARDVLRKLLYGSGYNILMIGDQGQGTPRSLVLSAQTKGGPPQISNSEPAAVDENADAADQPEEPQPQPPSIRNGFAPGAPPRSPQQIMQEMQQRQQQQGPPPQ